MLAGLLQSLKDRIAGRPRVRRAKEWPALRAAHLKLEPSCAACGGHKKLAVHHIRPVHLFPSEELSRYNLITLCDSPCHLIFGHLKSWKAWNPNVLTDTSWYRQKLVLRDAPAR